MAAKQRRVRIRKSVVMENTANKKTYRLNPDSFPFSFLQNRIRNLKTVAMFVRFEKLLLNPGHKILNNGFIHTNYTAKN